jgi:hypothetical protein
MKLTANQSIDVALTILTKHYENEGESDTRARTLAYAYLVGMLTASVSANKANQILEIVFNEYSPKEKVGV